MCAYTFGTYSSTFIRPVYSSDSGEPLCNVFLLGIKDCYQKWSKFLYFHFQNKNSKPVKFSPYLSLRYGHIIRKSRRIFDLHNSDSFISRISRILQMHLCYSWGPVNVYGNTRPGNLQRDHWLFHAFLRTELFCCLSTRGHRSFQYPF